MTKKQILLLRSCDSKLIKITTQTGSIQCTSDIILSLPPAITPNAGRVPLSEMNVLQIKNMIALSSTYDSNINNIDSVHHRLRLVAITLQLVKPTCNFLNLWLLLDGNNMTEAVDRTVSYLGPGSPEPYLAYQQHNCITEYDVSRALTFISRVEQALAPGFGSWIHPCLSIHRALILFCQGYSVNLPRASAIFMGGRIRLPVCLEIE